MSQAKKKYKYLPGDPIPKDNIASMIRVNHAGELGAVVIYKGQQAALKNSNLYDKLVEMEIHEREHFDYFDNQISERNIRPSFLYNIWKKMGFMLGYVSGKLSEKSAMTCTMAIENNIERHYAEQIETLSNINIDQELLDNIIQFREDELEHRDIAVECDAKESKIFYPVYYSVSLISKISIFIAKKI